MPAPCFVERLPSDRRPVHHQLDRVANDSLPEQARPSLLCWNPGPRRHRPNNVETIIAGPWALECLVARALFRRQPHDGQSTFCITYFYMNDECARRSDIAVDQVLKVMAVMGWARQHHPACFLRTRRCSSSPARRRSGAWERSQVEDLSVVEDHDTSRTTQHANDARLTCDSASSDGKCGWKHETARDSTLTRDNIHSRVAQALEPVDWDRSRRMRC